MSIIQFVIENILWVGFLLLSKTFYKIYKGEKSFKKIILDDVTSFFAANMLGFVLQNVPEAKNYLHIILAFGVYSGSNILQLLEKKGKNPEKFLNNNKSNDNN